MKNHYNKPKQDATYRGGTEEGSTMIMVLVFTIVIITFLAIYSQSTQLDIVTTKASKDAANGFFAAEAGLNIRAEKIRVAFEGFGNAPRGEGPVPGGSQPPCTGSNTGTASAQGTNDLGCETYTIGDREVLTYVTRDPGNPYDVEIPVGERYQGLNAQEDRFVAYSESKNHLNNVESILELTFKNRSVPLFQFGAFYDFDLELYPGPQMIMNGPVHANGDIYLSAGDSLELQGTISTTGTIIRGRKDVGGCPQSGSVSVWNVAGVPLALPGCRRTLTDSDVQAHGGTISLQVNEVDVPSSQQFNPTPGSTYWDLADLRLVLNLDPTTGAPITTSSPTGVEIRKQDDTVDQVLTTALHDQTKCPGNVRSLFLSSRDNDANLDDDLVNATVNHSNKVVGVSNLFYDRRELWDARPIQAVDTPQTFLEIDVNGLLNCIARQSDTNSDGLPDSSGTHLLGENLGSPKGLDDDTNNGLVIFTTVKGPRSQAPKSFYGIRIRNGEVLQASSVTGAPQVRGLSIVTDQPLYVAGNFNSPTPIETRVAAAFMSDSFNVLSEDWCADASWQAIESWDNTGNPLCDLKSLENQNKRRVTTKTRVYSAILGGSDQTSGSRESGGLHNFPRFHENWSHNNAVFEYRGSLVSLYQPSHAGGEFKCCDNEMVYNPPFRDWGFDEMFKNPISLPPATPVFTYLKQQLFERTFER